MAFSSGRPPPIAGRVRARTGAATIPTSCSAGTAWIHSRCACPAPRYWSRTSAASLLAALLWRARTTTSARPRTIGATVLDHAFTDLERAEDGLARVELQDPDSGTELTLWVDETYPYVMVFTGDPLPDVNRRSLAVEPMTCPPNAFRSGEGLVRLEPGESLTSSWGIDPREHPPP